jgi:hypothetical protein
MEEFNIGSSTTVQRRDDYDWGSGQSTTTFWASGHTRLLLSVVAYTTTTGSVAYTTATGHTRLLLATHDCYWPHTTVTGLLATHDCYWPHTTVTPDHTRLLLVIHDCYSRLLLLLVIHDAATGHTRLLLATHDCYWSTGHTRLLLVGDVHTAESSWRFLRIVSACSLRIAAMSAISAHINAIMLPISAVTMQRILSNVHSVQDVR